MFCVNSNKFASLSRSSFFHVVRTQHPHYVHNYTVPVLVSFVSMYKFYHRNKFKWRISQRKIVKTVSK